MKCPKWAVVVALAVFGMGSAAQSPSQSPPTPQQRVAVLKQWMQASQAQLRAYQWIETTVISKGGEEKSRKQNTCYYGADGNLQKVAVAGAAPEKSGGGPLKKKIAANKKEEMTAYMQSAVALVKSYVPPDPALIQQSQNAGKVSVNMIEPNRRIRLDFKDYLKPGDVLGVEIELPTNRLLGANVSSYLDSPEDPVTLKATMSVLPDGTIYTARTVLDAKAQDLTVTVENSGYRRTAN